MKTNKGTTFNYYHYIMKTTTLAKFVIYIGWESKISDGSKEHVDLVVLVIADADSVVNADSNAKVVEFAIILLRIPNFGHGNES